MNKGDTSRVIALLIDSEVLTPEDAHEIHDRQVEVLVEVMLERRAILATEASKARDVITTLATSTNHRKRHSAKVVLLELIAANFHHRLDAGFGKIRHHTKRLTTGNLHAVVPEKA